MTSPKPKVTKKETPKEINKRLADKAKKDKAANMDARDSQVTTKKEKKTVAATSAGDAARTFGGMLERSAKRIVGRKGQGDE
jgi:hypothetical protein